ncbi:hypothetical protein, partial [Flavobacterium sp.]|uniref:hypothetical protein n=1 Tax=Flavobacterium sp. TaxID=239 RepID=UPI0025C00282
ELFPTVEIAKRPKYQIDVSGITDAVQKKWQKDLVRHFADPAAFYGLHFNIKGGIEYRQGVNKPNAITTVEVYQNIITKFQTKNKVYLDIRNENGYSYNYYDNYVGTGTDADKELKIAQDSGNLVLEEYYTDGWAIHTVDITSGSGTQNEFFIALRVNDNERPLIAAWNTELTPNLVIDPPLSDDAASRVYFTDETVLLPNPEPLPEFTEAVSIKVPNVLSESVQLATIVRLDYIKQIQFYDPIVGDFPYWNRTDYLFGPLTTQIPWDSDDGTQWIDSHHRKFVDGFNQGFISGKEEFDIDTIDPALKKITINQVIDQHISNKIRIRNVSTHWQNVGEYNVIKVEVVGTNTEITVLDSIQTKYPGDRIVVEIEVAVTIERGHTGLIAKDIDLSGIPAFQIGKKIKLYTVFSSNAKDSRKITDLVVIGGWSHIILDSPIKQLGFGAIMQTGMVSETDLSTGTPPPDNDNILFYAIPSYYYKRYGMKKTNLFNYKGGTNGSDSFVKMIQKQTKNFEIQKSSLQPTIGNFLATLSYKDKTKEKEIILLLGLKKSEFEDLKTAATAQLSPYHLQMLKLIPQGNRLRDEDYEPYYKYHLVITGKDSNGDYAETSVFKEIYSRDGLIFTSPEYAQSEFISQQEANSALNLFINDNDFSGLTVYSIEENKELNKDGSNWERNLNNKVLLGLDPVIKNLIEELRNELDLVNDNASEIRTLIEYKATELLTLSRQRIRVNGTVYQNKDGILYIARLMMQIVLKNHPKLINNMALSENLSAIFEKNSRGIEGSAKADFNSYPSTHKRILISGYDPFGAGADWQGHNSNSSGNIALAMDGVEIINGSHQGIVRSAIFPVRYYEFNEGWIENFFEPYINPNHPKYQPVDIIITFSYGGAKYFNIDRFSARYRNPNHTDNNAELGGSSIYLNKADKDNLEFIESKLPYNDLYIPDRVLLHQRAFFEYYNGNIPTGQKNYTINNFNLTPLLPTPSILNYPPPSSVDANRIKSFYGSGGDYLSNEIFYRVAFLRQKYNQNLKTGHIHVGFLDSAPSASLDRDLMLSLVRQALENTLINL